MVISTELLIMGTYALGIIVSVKTMDYAKPHYWYAKYISNDCNKRASWLEIGLVATSWMGAVFQLANMALAPPPLPPMPTHDEVDASKFPF